MNFRRSIAISAVAGVALLAASCGADDSVTDPVATTAESSPTTDRTSTTTDSAATTTAGSTTTDSSATTDSSGSGPTTSDLELDERVDDIRDALSNGDFSTMLDLLDLTGLSDELEGREITVLAPTEAAFQDLSVDDLGELITDKDRAEALLRRHILDGVYTYDELAALTEVTTISDETLPVSTEGDSVIVAGATVTPPDAGSMDGEEGQEVAVFGIDQILLTD